MEIELQEKLCSECNPICCVCCMADEGEGCACDRFGESMWPKPELGQ